jgi:hypothetical protein
MRRMAQGLAVVAAVLAVAAGGAARADDVTIQVTPGTQPPAQVPASPPTSQGGRMAPYRVAAPTLGLVTPLIGFAALVTTCLAVVVDSVALVSALRRVSGTCPARRQARTRPLIELRWPLRCRVLSRD